MRRTDQQEVGQIRPIQSVGSSSRSRGIEDDGPCSRVHGPWTKSRSRIKRLCPVSFLFLFFFFPLDCNLTFRLIPILNHNQK